MRPSAEVEAVNTHLPQPNPWVKLSLNASGARLLAKLIGLPNGYFAARLRRRLVAAADECDKAPIED